MTEVHQAASCADVPTSAARVTSAVAEVVTLASELIAIDTTNTGDPVALGTERAAAEYVTAKLAEVGYEPIYVESGARGRGNVVVRLPGADPSRGALPGCFRGRACRDSGSRCPT